jgi:hypothetical protein
VVRHRVAATELLGLDPSSERQIPDYRCNWEHIGKLPNVHTRDLRDKSVGVPIDKFKPTTSVDTVYYMNATNSIVIVRSLFE